MKQSPLPMALRFVLAVSVILTMLSPAAAWDWTILYGDTQTPEFLDYCASGCNITGVDSYKNIADGLWGNTSSYHLIIRYTGSTERAYAHFAIPILETRADIVPESLRLEIKAWSYAAGNDAQTILFGPDNETWYKFDYNSTAGFRNVIHDSNLTVTTDIMDFINSSNFLNIYFTINTTASSDGVSFSGINLTAEIYNSSERIVTNCTNLDHQKAIGFNFFDESAPTAALNTTIDNIQFDYDLPNGTERSMALNYGYNTTQWVCIYPSTENFTTDMQAQYVATNYSHRHWYFTNARLDNITDVVNLYLINDTLDDQIAIHVRDENLGDKEGAEVRVLRWMPPAYNTGTILKTNTEGKAYAWVDKDEWYKFQVLYNGTLYKTTEPTQLISYDTTTSYVIDVSFEDAVPYITWVSGIAYTITLVADVYTAIITDTTGLMASGYMNVTQINITATTNVCEKVSTGASFTLTCDLSAQPNGMYDLRTYLQMDDGEYWILDTRPLQIGEPETKVGGDGLIMAAVFVGTVAFAGLIHPVLAVFMTIIGLVAVTAMQLALISWASVIAILAVGLVVVYVISRGGQNK